MLRFLLLLLAVFAFPYIFAQKIVLNWGLKNTEDYGVVIKNLPKFSNSGYETDGNNIFVNVKGPRNGSYRIANVQWEKADMQSLFDLDATALPDRDRFSVSYYFNRAQNAEYYNARLATFKNVNGVVYRLASFDIVNDSSTLSARQNLSAKLGTSENPLKRGTFYKIKVDRSGIFKITRKFLSDNGLNPASINPKNFRIYGNGGVMLPEYINDSRYAALQENAIQVTGEDDGKWDDGDYALFYAQGPNAFKIYSENYIGTTNKRTETRIDNSLHVQNIYDDYSYYFINFDIGEGKRVQLSDTAVPATLITRYDDYQFIDEEKNNLLKIGRSWVGDAFITEKNVTFTTRTPLQATDNIRYRASVVAYQSRNNSVKFNINGKNEYTANVPSSNEGYQKINTFRGTVNNLSGNAINITITPSISANPNGTFYFDYAEVLYKQDLSFNGSQMNFRDYSLNEGSGQQYGFSVSDASEIEQIWDVSDITNAKQKANKASGNTFSFGYLASDGNFSNEFVAFKNSAAYTPQFVGKIDNQDLSGLQNVDYLIITKSTMLGEARRLADYHKNKNGYSTEVVDVEKIYNEFSSGSRDVTAIRDFVAKLNNENGGLKFLTILGDSSYDYKNKTTNNDNIVPTYESEESGNYVSSYVTDDFFATASAGQSPYVESNLPDLPVGRLLASNTAEAKVMVDKTLAYYNALPGQSSPFGEWRMKLDFVVDDDADDGEPFHNVMNRAIVDNFESGTRSEYNIKKLYLDAFAPDYTSGGQRYPLINQAISNDVGNSLYLFYFGHGGINGWAQERVLTADEIKNFNNFNSAYSRFPLISTITCEFTLWDTPDVLSAGEQTIKLASGGSATMITSSRAVGVQYGRLFTDTFTKNIFTFKEANNAFYTLGEAFLMAKQEFGPDSNHYKVNFLGDPAMALSRPKQYLTVDKIESPDASKFRALDFIKISGKINKADGTVDTGFNGRVVVNIFDKRLNKSTRNNDNSAAMLPLLQYTEEGSPIVKGSGKAVNGVYTAEFYVPKDINYTVGKGRMMLYAENFDSAKSNAYDVYNNQEVTVGDINPAGISDSQPPKINLYLNNTNFADGGITDQNPMLLACVTDDTGINSTGSGIGHDITVILDGQIINTMVLNDFFTAGETNGCVNSSLADYQKGSVTYPFRNLSPGEHQLVFKVWDINNNSATSTLNFVVKNEAEQKLIINRPLNWPNPFTNKTYIQFEHNCDDILDVNVQIYTITGKLVRTLTQQVVAEPFLQGYRTPRQAIEWDGKDDFGDTVGKGTYIFKIYARSQNQDKCKGGATAVEKMVLLK